MSEMGILQEILNVLRDWGALDISPPPKVFHYPSGSTIREKNFLPFNEKFTGLSQSRHKSSVKISAGKFSPGRISTPMSHSRSRCVMKKIQG
jgi:hypothetical protein